MKKHLLNDADSKAAFMGVELGRKTSDAASAVNIILATSRAKELRLDMEKPDEVAALEAITFDIGVMLRVNAVVQIMAPIVAEVIDKHEKSGDGCLDSCINGLIDELLSGVKTAAIDQGRGLHAVLKRNDEAAGLMSDPEADTPESRATSEEATRRLAEIMASFGKLH